MAGDRREGSDVTLQEKNYKQAVGEVAERAREVIDLLLDARDAMTERRPKDAWKHLNDAKSQLDGAMIMAKWSQTLFPEES